MNGRIYDAKLARFLQADPFIQAATDTQSYNRYSYVMNNPLNKSDPSGFFWKKLWNELKPYIGAIVTIALISTGTFAPLAGMIGGAIGGLANGGGLAGMVQGMAFGAFSGAFGGIGNIYGRFMAQGMLGGMQSVMAGGKFGHGFFSAGIGGLGGGNGYSVQSFVQSAVLGGVASEITGGKFKNGAASATFMYAVSMGISKFGPGGQQNSPQKSSSNSAANDEESLFNDTMRKMSDTDRVKFSVKRSNGQVDITVTGTVESMTSSEAQILIDGVKKYWDVSKTASDGTIYTLSVRLESSMFGGGFRLEMNDMPPTKNGSQAFRSHVQRRVMRLWSGDPNISATAAHEFGHIMGFGDQYVDVGKSSVALPGHNADIMGTGYGVEAYHLRALAAKYGN